MWVAEDVVLKPRDGDAKEFYLMTLDEIKAAFLGDKFKAISTVVAANLFTSYGIISVEVEPNCPEINMRLHCTPPFATSPRL